MKLARVRNASFGRVVGVTLVVGLLLCASTLSSSAAERPGFPGLPADDPNAQLLAPRATGLTEAKAARQWVRIQAIQAVAFASSSVQKEDVTCRRLGPYSKTEDYSARIHISSRPGSPNRYGYIGPFTARTVAFGSIPVEASIRVRQQRDSDNLPIPLQAEQHLARFCPGLGPHAEPGEVEWSNHDTKVSGPVDIEITALAVDGVDLQLKQSCRTAKAVDLNLSAPDVFDLDPTLGSNDPFRPPEEGLSDPDLITQAKLERVMTSPYFFFTSGGLLTAKIDIPPFKGCTTASGEDISPLLTSAISGPDNSLKLRSESLREEAMRGACWESNTCEPLPAVPMP